jgi:hypothetical protein
MLATETLRRFSGSDLRNPSRTGSYRFSVPGLAPVAFRLIQLLRVHHVLGAMLYPPIIAFGIHSLAVGVWSLLGRLNNVTA